MSILSNRRSTSASSERRLMSSTEAITARGKSLWTTVVREMVRRIVSGQLAAGDTLPTEPQIGAEFVVSRTVVRESIRVLVEKGLIRIDRGRGTVVNDQSEWRQLDSWVMAARLENEGAATVLADLMAMRLGLEPEFASLAAEKQDATALQRIQDAFGEMESVRGEPEAYAMADSAFHEAIVEASGNSLAPELFRQLSEPLLIARRLTNHITGALDHAHQDHQRILDAILAADGPAAHDAMRKHILFAREHLDEVM
ncbi:FadR/GntR family transcriptional regulator [Microbacterium sp. NPDC057650]|uniref:FadR/GntR family transcriptional regulator n=1 Tax=unclassified Microbacterium TaxID=2609290 RepID=UPI003672DB6A